MFKMSLITATACVVLAGCEVEEVEKQPAATAPEYYPCRKVPEALKTADALLRNPSRLSANERAYWYSRQDRLVKRAWDCKG
ncbi:hypothetical protein [Aliiroseovarius lamellibrachiae]|uniref:hypothetical protein n=1 Tax=Aliiroseovarius lamellibrachiae TaxID=1924933 RepID=UPI001BDFD736|nr:hypothetical protein [Aliiroseovarius lamellibrachiae]MBT2130602.1 hypothetical protein [Aliiroseovarius lamellibrachiae]